MSKIVEFSHTIKVKFSFIGPTKYSIIHELGKGNYARVLKATRDDQSVALKLQRPSWEWEWYIVRELQKRLPPDVVGIYYIYIKLNLFIKLTYMFIYFVKVQFVNCSYYIKKIVFFV